MDKVVDPEVLRHSVDELRALVALIRRSPLDDVTLEQSAAMAAAQAIQTVLSALSQPLIAERGREAAYCENIGRVPSARDIEESLKHVRALCDHAYDQGYHELGYDPVAVIASALLRPSASKGVVEALKAFAQLEKSITADVSTAHSMRGSGASSEMRSDDRDMRAALRHAFGLLHAALSNEGAGSDG